MTKRDLETEPLYYLGNKSLIIGVKQKGLRDFVDREDGT